ncbi:MAG: rod shape-determining protein MreC, partial [Muribaculaceae bacterium]|nr:rod shape-determining protein MreC [Muribaculaceae bacterium]
VEEIPRHAVFTIGDTIVTSGYSTTFPEGIPVGKVLARVKSGDDSFFTLKVKLATDFRSLSTVRVIKDIYKTEIDSLADFDELKME